MVLYDQAEVVLLQLGTQLDGGRTQQEPQSIRWCKEALGDFTRSIGDFSRRIGDVLLTSAQVELMVGLVPKPPASCIMWHHFG